jgi:hypothetical protein
MRTTVEIPDELLNRAKERAAREGRTLKSFIVEGLEYAVTRPAIVRPLRKANFPIIKSVRHGGKITDETVNDAIEQMYVEEAQRHTFIP